MKNVSLFCPFFWYFVDGKNRSLLLQMLLWSLCNQKEQTEYLKANVISSVGLYLTLVYFNTAFAV